MEEGKKKINRVEYDVEKFVVIGVVVISLVSAFVLRDASKEILLSSVSGLVGFLGRNAISKGVKLK